MQGTKIEYDALNNRGGIVFYHRGHPQNEEPVYHDFVSIAYVAHGEGFHISSSGRAEAAEGDIFITNPNVTHCFVSSDRSDFIEIYYCNFLPEMHKKLCDHLRDEFRDLEPFFDNTDIKTDGAAFCSSVSSVKEKSFIFLFLLSLRLWASYPCPTNTP